MSKRDFGSTKCLLHFDFPYFNEPNDGLDDDVGIETWSRSGTAVKLYGSAIPNEGTQAPKFGYRCIRSSTGTARCTNTSGVWNLNSSGDYEIEFFVYTTANGSTRYPFRLYTASTTVGLTVALDASGYITVLCSAWGISSAVPSGAAVATGSWQHILFRISNNTLKVYLNGTQRLAQELTPNVTLSVDNVRLGYSSSSVYYMDEFVFRHSAGTGNPTVPKRPYSGKLKLSTVGGYQGVGAVAYSSLSTSTANRQVNSYGIISTITNAKTFTVSSWSSGDIAAATKRELMIHITAPKSTSSATYPLVGLYAFAQIESISGTSIILSREISTENGDDFTLSSSLLSTYYVQAITVPCYTSVTLNSAGSIIPLTWSTTTGGGIVVFRTFGDCTINGKILTHGKGAVRYDLQQVTNSKLIDRFLCSKGGGIFISCGGTLTIGSGARLGASWSGASGAGVNAIKSAGGNGGAGYGGAGGADDDSNSIAGNGGVGGGGGGANGGAAGSFTASNAGANSNTGGSGRSDNSNISTGGTQGSSVNGSGKGGAGGGGGAGGIGGKGTDTGVGRGGYSGASIILIAKTLKADAMALSTGGEGGLVIGGGGGGTGFCYIACERQVS